MPAGKSTAYICRNRRALHDYTLGERFEAGLELRGWEAKSLRAGSAQITEGYIHLNKGQAYLLNAHIPPLPTVASHLKPDPRRQRRLLLHRKELNRIRSAMERKGYTAVPLNMHWKRGNAKLELALAKGRRQQDKRAHIKEQDWRRQQQRYLKTQGKTPRAQNSD